MRQEGNVLRGYFLLAEHGSHELIRCVRQAENLDPDRHEPPRLKRPDNATVALCLFEEPR